MQSQVSYFSCRSAYVDLQPYVKKVLVNLFKLYA